MRQVLASDPAKHFQTQLTLGLQMLLGLLMCSEIRDALGLRRFVMKGISKRRIYPTAKEVGMKSIQKILYISGQHFLLLKMVRTLVP